jgi:hypothetical protein
MNLDTYKTTIGQDTIERGSNQDGNVKAYPSGAASGERRAGTQLEVSTENTEI